MRTTRILQATVKFLQEQEWSYTLKEGESPLLIVGYEGENGQWKSIAIVREQEEQLIFYSQAPVQVPEEKRQHVAEFLTRANYGLTMGNFEMDFDDGEVRYRTSLDVEGVDISSELIQPVIYANLSSMDKYLPGLLLVLSSDVTPKEACRKVQAGEAF